jgi:hypothetical protein
MARSHLDTKLAEIIAKFPDLEVVWFVDDEIAKSNFPFVLKSVEIEEYFADQCLSGDDNIKDWIFSNRLTSSDKTHLTEKQLDDSVIGIFEVMQYVGEVTRNIIVKLGVE